jgi:DNA anti-recombination protein RmuC
VGALAKHFEQARTDVEQIQISTRKITDRGSQIENLQLDGESKEPALRLISETMAS